MAVSKQDRAVLRELGCELAEIGNLPAQKETAGLWRKLNRLEPVRPLVWINEIPWHEMDRESELAPRTSDPFCRQIEDRLRREIYQWKHLRVDMVVDPVIYCGHVFGDSGFGLEATDKADPYGSHAAHYEPLIHRLEDVEKIQVPKITPDWEATERNYEIMSEIFAGVLPVQQRGVAIVWCAPWDILIKWYGVEKFFLDMIDAPELVHAAIGRMMEALLGRLEQLEKMRLLAVSNGNHRVGAGGLGITDELPRPDYDPDHVSPLDQWGSSTGQIFSDVSPEMHDEFCLQYEQRWLERFGLTCYGCCEPLHKKMHLLRTIPNLRRVSMSPWIDVDEAAAVVGADYVFSSKPNPAIFAAEQWSPDEARRQLRAVLEKTRGCRVEIIMKDISTVRNEPRRLWEWTRIAMEIAQEFA